jgi:hypothetical protein
LRYIWLMQLPPRRTTEKPRLDRNRLLWAAVARLVGPLAVAFFSLTTIATGCGGACDGDRVLVDGTCVPRCEDAACGDDLSCVHSVCRPRCTRDSDCKGDDVCESIKTDEGKSGKYCFGLATYPSPYLDEPAPSPTTDSNDSAAADTSCEKSSDCERSVPHYCVAGECRTACTLHAHCGRAGVCTGSAENTEEDRVTYCQPDAFARAPGQYGSQCLTGTSSCDTEAGFQCIGAGDGDVDSYCTQAGCDADTDCPSGLFCSENRVGSRPPCESACGVSGQPDAPNCVPKADIGAGKPFRCGEAGGLLLTLCIERSFCAPCDSDADCRGAANQVCARGADGVKTCTVLCAPGQGSCPWGDATECAVFDSDLGVATCGHRFGACRGSGKSCEPCTHDGDCPTGFCAKSDFSGELFCYDQDVTCECGADEDICVGGGCPEAPGGKPMNCVSTGDGAPPSACYGAEIDETAGTPLGCW